MNGCSSLIPLLVIGVLGSVVEGQLPGVVPSRAPGRDQLALLLPLATCLALIGKVGGDLQFEAEGRRLLGEVGEVDIFVDTAADIARQPQFERLFRRLRYLSAALVGFPARGSRWQRDV